MNFTQIFPDGVRLEKTDFQDLNPGDVVLVERKIQLGLINVFSTNRSLTYFEPAKIESFTPKRTQLTIDGKKYRLDTSRYYRKPGKACLRDGDTGRAFASIEDYNSAMQSESKTGFAGVISADDVEVIKRIADLQKQAIVKCKEASDILEPSDYSRKINSIAARATKLAIDFNIEDLRLFKSDVNCAVENLKASSQAIETLAEKS